MAINTAGQTATGNSPGADSPRAAFGKIVFDATAITAADYIVVSVGFTPKYVSFRQVHATTGIQIEWFEGMAEDTCIKTNATDGVVTLETTNKGITICNSDGTANTSGKCFKVSQNATLAVISASKTNYWTARS